MFRSAFIIANLILMLLFCSPAAAQSKLHVESGEDHAALTFASVVNFTRNRLVFTDEKGNVNNEFQNGDSLSISYVGYNNLNFIYKNSQVPVYMLTKKSELLQIVQVKPCNDPKYFTYSNLDADTTKRKFGGIGWSESSNNAKVAILLKPSIKYGYLKAISIWLVKSMGAPKISVKAPIKLSFCEINDSTNLPGELISSRQIIYFPKKEGKQTIQADSLHVRIPENGMYLCLEYVIDKKYEWPIRYVDTAKGIDSIMMQYGARIDGVYSKDFTAAFYIYQEDRWYFAGHTTSTIADKTPGTIKCSVEISYCEAENIPE